MKTMFVLLSLLTVSATASADITTSPTPPFSFCAQEYAAGYASCAQSQSAVTAKKESAAQSSAHQDGEAIQQ